MQCSTPLVQFMILGAVGRSKVNLNPFGIKHQCSTREHKKELDPERNVTVSVGEAVE